MFTAENAAEMGKRGNVALAESKLRKRALTADPSQETAEAESFRKIRLLRVRKQLDSIDRAIDEAMAGIVDPAKLDRLASAAIRLNEQERQLSNRSLPPTLKADAKSRKPRSADFDPPQPSQTSSPSVAHTTICSVPESSQVDSTPQDTQSPSIQPDTTSTDGV